MLKKYILMLNENLIWKLSSSSEWLFLFVFAAHPLTHSLCMHRERKKKFSDILHRVGEKHFKVLRMLEGGFLWKFHV